MRFCYARLCYVQTIPVCFSCQHLKLSRVVWTSIHYPTQAIGTVQHHSINRNHAEITVRLIEPHMLQKHHLLSSWDQSQILWRWGASTFYSNDRKKLPKATTKTHKKKPTVSFPSSLSWVLNWAWKPLTKWLAMILPLLLLLMWEGHLSSF